MHIVYAAATDPRAAVVQNVNAIGLFRQKGFQTSGLSVRVRVLVRARSPLSKTISCSVRSTLDSGFSNWRFPLSSIQGPQATPHSPRIKRSSCPIPRLDRPGLIGSPPKLPKYTVTPRWLTALKTKRSCVRQNSVSRWRTGCATTTATPAPSSAGTAWRQTMDARCA